MQLSSVRELKDLFTQTILAADSAPAKMAARLAGPAERAAGPVGTLALGITSSKPNDFRLAVRYQHRELATSKVLEEIRNKTGGELDERYIGRVTKLAGRSWTQKRHNPLRLGTSIGHYLVEGGTLGAVVRRKSDDVRLLLSNNHILANENKARPGDAILQPASCDRGTDPADRVATLADMVKLKQSGVNYVDCAVAAPLKDVDVDPSDIMFLGKLAGVGPDLLNFATTVAKLGRTTGLTRGRVTAFEVDNVILSCVDDGFAYNLRFDRQVEIEGKDADPFSKEGDSGSLVVTDDLRAVALLFAGAEMGGRNGQGLAYANPIRAVLSALDVELVT
jgi:hypothetical protein